MNAQLLQQKTKSFRRALQNGTLPGVDGLTLPDDSDLSVWQFSVTSEAFDQSSPATRQLKADLQRIKGYGHPAALLMEVRFPTDFPTSPFFLRVVSPRIKYLCGHVTVGGSICIELLTNSGSSSSWQPTYVLEGVLPAILSNMMHVEIVKLATQTGPGGVTGNLALDMSLGARVVQPYSLSEAETAFQRTLQNHGWNNSRTAGGAARGGGGGAGGGGISRAAVQQQPPTAAAPAPAPAASAEPSLAARLAAANAQHGLHLLPPPPHWDISDELLHGHTVFTDLPLPVGHPHAGRLQGGGGRAGGGADVSEDVLDLEANGLTREQAIKALEEAGGDVELAVQLQFFKQQRPLSPTHNNTTGGGTSKDNANEAAIQELMRNNVSRTDAEEALYEADGDVDKAFEFLLSELGNVVDEESVQELVANGVARGDAEAALRVKKGDTMLALMFCFECSGKGVSPKDYAGASGSGRGSGRSRKRQKRSQAAQRGAAEEDVGPAAAAVAVAAEAARQRALKLSALRDEAEAVLKRFEYQGVSRNRVVLIQRVQNLELHSDYQRFKDRLAAKNGGVTNEKRLFHGANKETLDKICREGFDMRLANMGGALGAGVYFAESSTYSESYSKQPRRDAHAQLRLPAGITAGAGHRHHHPHHQHHQQQQHPSPAFQQGCVAMLLADVTLGASMTGQPGLRKPHDGFHSASGGAIWAVFDNKQAYPTYIIHYKEN